jgi:hypothetical protein
MGGGVIIILHLKCGAHVERRKGGEGRGRREVLSVSICTTTVQSKTNCNDQAIRSLTSTYVSRVRGNKAAELTGRER